MSLQIGLRRAAALSSSSSSSSLLFRSTTTAATPVSAVSSLLGRFSTAASTAVRWQSFAGRSPWSFGTVDVPRGSKLSTLIQAGKTFEESYSEEDLVANVAELELRVENARKDVETKNRNVLDIEKKIENLERDVVAADSAVEDASRILESVPDAEQDRPQTRLLEDNLNMARWEKQRLTNAINLSEDDLKTQAKLRNDATMRLSNAEAELELVQARLAAVQKRVSTVQSLDVRCSALSDEFLRENNLGGYADAAIVCKEKSDVKAFLDNLESLYEESTSFSFPFGSIVAPSGTGKTQLAATAAACERNVRYFYTGLAGDSPQSFYKPHATVRRELFSALKDLKREEPKLVEELEPPGAQDIRDVFANNEKVFLLFTLLSKVLLHDDSPSTFKMLQDGIRQIPKNRRLMVFLDEVPPTGTSHFNNVLLLRNVLRAVGVCPILMSTHSGASNAVAMGSDSRQGDDGIWCRKFARLHPLAESMFLSTVLGEYKYVFLGTAQRRDPG